ncbi:MAG: hypothetical protein WAQ99_21275 [Pyrinomonadaceae bacterium]
MSVCVFVIDLKSHPASVVLYLTVLGVEDNAGTCASDVIVFFLQPTSAYGYGPEYNIQIYPHCLLIKKVRLQIHE